MTTGIIERELQRTVWRRYRDTLCLVDASDPRFGEGGLAARMHELSMRVLVLPGDPERDLIAFDEEFWARFTQGHQDPISGNDAAWVSIAPFIGPGMTGVFEPPVTLLMVRSWASPRVAGERAWHGSSVLR
jgi:hypothetical protein